MAMRLPPIAPPNLSKAQRSPHESTEANLDAYMHGFVSVRADGALIAPFAPGSEVSTA